MSSDNKKTKNDRNTKQYKENLSSGLEDYRVKFAEKKPSALQDEAQVMSGHKVEMHTLCLSKELENSMLDTLRNLHGENFTLKYKSDYRDKGKALGKKYWVNTGGLVVLGGVNYSQKNRTKTFSEVNGFAINKLEKFGFYRSHCIEVLQATNCDVGASLELIISRYFNLPLADISDSMQDITPQDILEQRLDELGSLESIYESNFQVRIPNRVWTLKLELPYLLKLYPATDKKSLANNCTVINGPRKNPSKELCFSVTRGAKCKFGEKCRFSHEIPNKSDEKLTAIDTSFVLEIRFPPGSNYPLEAPFISLSTENPHFPTNVSLRLTSRLIREAKECAEQCFPSIYTLAHLLSNQEDEILEFLKTVGEAFPDPDKPILTTLQDECQIEDETQSDTEENYKTGREKTARRKPINMLERISMDDTLERNFMTLNFRNDKYQKALTGRSKLPAWNKKNEILANIERYQVVVISGETGCGKSTQVPQFILDNWLLNRSNQPSDKKLCEIVCTQPRRLSAIGVAERVAEERADKVGGCVGYQIRLESKMSSSTRLLFCTTGILLRRLENDPDLSTVTHIIIDEVHERSEESDFLLLIIKQLLQKRSDLRVILMSATLNANLFSTYFNDAPSIDIPGRTFPVKQIFLDEIIESTQYVLEENSQYARKIKDKKKKTGLETDINSIDCELATADVLSSLGPTPKDHVLDEMLSLPHLVQRYNGCSMTTVKSLYLMDPDKINYDLIEAVLTWIVRGEHGYPSKGTILVFLPGFAEIQFLYDQLTNHALFSPRSGNFVLVPLHSTLSPEEQSAVFQKPKNGARKIVLSTNIAETSITIDDCVYVVDAGRMKEKRFDTNKNMESLDVTWVSKANASQRRGRAGRVMPGVCIHLYTSFRHDHHFLGQPVPELHRIPLDQLLLRIKLLPNFSELSVHEVLGGMMEPPQFENIETAISRLKDVGAMDNEQGLTPLGHHLAKLPVDVRIGKLLLFGSMFCCVDSALTMAACLSYKSPFSSVFSKREEVEKKKKEFSLCNSDHLTSLVAYNTWMKAKDASSHARKMRATEYFLSWRTLITIADIKHQFLELLVDIGFISMSVPRRRSGVDRILELTGTELNENGENYKFLSGLLCAALFPNIVKVLTPAKTYAPSVAGAIPKELKPEELIFKTKQDDRVFLHPSSVNYNVNYFSTPYLVYHEKLKTSRVFIRDCTMVPLLALVLFISRNIVVELHQGITVLSLADGWILLSVNSHQVAELLQMMHVELNRIMQDKINDPSINLFTYSRSKRVVSTILKLVTNG